MSLVIGTLTSNEQIVIDKLSRLGLGFAVDRTTINDNKPSTSSITVDHKHERKCTTENLPKPKPIDQRHEGKCTMEILPKPTQVQHLADIPSAIVKVELLKLAPTDRVLVTPKVLDSLPSMRLLTPMTVKYHTKKVTPS